MTSNKHKKGSLTIFNVQKCVQIVCFIKIAEINLIFFLNFFDNFRFKSSDNYYLLILSFSNFPINKFIIDSFRF